MARSEKKPAPRKAAAAAEGNRRAELIRAAGRLFALPSNPALAMSGITTESLPRVFEATARQLLEGLLS